MMMMNSRLIRSNLSTSPHQTLLKSTYVFLASSLINHQAFAFLSSPSLTAHHQIHSSAFAATFILNNKNRVDGIPHHKASSLIMASSNNISDGSEGGSSNNYNLAQDPTELFDIYQAPPSESYYNSIITPDWGASYYPSPQPTGKVKERGLVHKDGDWHRSVQVWIVQRDTTNVNNVRVLLQRRSPYKDTHPNQLDVSCAGHVNAGDDILETTIRELEEELGGKGTMMKQYSIEDLKNSRVFTVTSSIMGETAKHGKYLCQEYQDVFILWLREHDSPMDTTMFAPLVEEEVSGFEIMDGNELMKRLRHGDEEFVPRSTEYVNALEEYLDTSNQCA